MAGEIGNGFFYSVVMPILNRYVLLIVLLLAACSESVPEQSEGSKRISALIKSQHYKNIDFSVYGSSIWTKVCFLGPYNEQSEALLNLPWKISSHTNVLKDDGHNVIIFATESKVIEYVVHSRGRGDFSKLSGQCIPRSESQFRNKNNSDQWPEYVLKKA